MSAINAGKMTEEMDVRILPYVYVPFFLFWFYHEIQHMVVIWNIHTNWIWIDRLATCITILGSGYLVYMFLKVLVTGKWPDPKAYKK